MSITVFERDGHSYEMGCEMLDVTSLHRPDTGWKFIDAHGHEHCWYEAGATDTAELTLPALRYDPMAKYVTPTLLWVKDGEEYWPDSDEPHPVGHWECVVCLQHIEPRYCADEHRVYIPGLRWCKIDGQSVSLEEFQRRYMEAKGNGK